MKHRLVFFSLLFLALAPTALASNTWYVEEDFLGFSYGFRPGRGQHDALDALSYALLKKKVNCGATVTYGTRTRLVRSVCQYRPCR
jgi:hypothetical protein